MKSFLRKNKLALWLGVVFILLFVGFMVLMSCIQRQMFIDIHKENLQILANEKAAQVNMFLEFQKEKLSIIASMDVFKEAAMYPNDSSKVEAAKNMINELKNTILGISILTEEGIAVIGEFDLPGTDYTQHPYFASKEEKKIAFQRYYDPQRKADYYAIIGLIYDDTDKSKIIGIIALDVRLDELSALMKETFRTGTNEVYLIDETGLLLSNSKYIGQGNKNGVLIQEVESDGAKVCLEHIKKYGKSESVEEHTEEVIQYANYMGNEVFGAHAYVPSIMGCVIAEEGADEILKFSMLDYIKNIFNK